jgi:hypothetical protein
MECDDNQDNDGRDDDSGALAMESAMTGAASGLRIEEVDKRLRQTRGRSNCQSSSALSCLLYDRHLSKGQKAR